jgi:hypothetical protein
MPTDRRQKKTPEVLPRIKDVFDDSSQKSRRRRSDNSYQPVPPQLRDRTPDRKIEKFNIKQRIFIDKFLDTGIIGASALLAGYKSVATGTLLLKKKKILQEIERRRSLIQATADEQLGINALSVIKELATIAFSNVGDSYTDWGSRQKTITVPVKGAKGQTRQIEVAEVFAAVKGKAEMPLPQQRCIAELYEEADPRGRTKLRIKNHDKLKALQMLANYFGLTDGVGRKGDDANDMVNELRQAAASGTSLFPGNGMVNQSMMETEADSEEELPR